MPDVTPDTASRDVARGAEPKAAPPAQPFIDLSGIGLRYRTASGDVEAVRDVSFKIQRGEFVSVVGPSGCGKSTLLKMIAGLLAPSTGTIAIDKGKRGADAGFYGMVFQAPILLPWRSVLDNVLLAAELASVPARPLIPRARDLLAKTGLANFEAKFPRELSGGMQQRVSLCRALLLDPPVLLMDEPFGALDAMTRDEMNLELLRIWGEDDGTRKTVVFVTHSIPEAVFLSDRVVVMTARPGQIADVFDIDLPRPRTVRLRASADFGQLSLTIYEALKAKQQSAAMFL